MFQQLWSIYGSGRSWNLSFSREEHVMLLTRRGPMSDVPPVISLGLNEQEALVALIVATGLTDEQIAEASLLFDQANFIAVLRKGGYSHINGSQHGGHLE